MKKLYPIKHEQGWEYIEVDDDMKVTNVKYK
jgi:hypothetical protein